jgi:hypothetical protein
MFLGGRTATCTLAELDDFVTERGNPGNRRGVGRMLGSELGEVAAAEIERLGAPDWPT